MTVLDRIMTHLIASCQKWTKVVSSGHISSVNMASLNGLMADLLNCRGIRQKAVWRSWTFTDLGARSDYLAEEHHCPIASIIEASTINKTRALLVKKTRQEGHSERDSRSNNAWPSVDSKRPPSEPSTAAAWSDLRRSSIQLARFNFACCALRMFLNYRTPRSATRCFAGGSSASGKIRPEFNLIS